MPTLPVQCIRLSVTPSCTNSQSICHTSKKSTDSTCRRLHPSAILLGKQSQYTDRKRQKSRTFPKRLCKLTRFIRPPRENNTHPRTHHLLPIPTCPISTRPIPKNLHPSIHQAILKYHRPVVSQESIESRCYAGIICVEQAI